MQTLRLRRSDQRIMRDRQQIFGHKPDGILRSHPVQTIETAHIYGTGEGSEGAFPAKIEVSIEITER